MNTSGRTLITCHANADFDAFAAMLAARRLYSPCSLLFPGSQERSLQKLVSALDATSYDLVESNTIRWADYTCLVLVDTHQRSRVPHVAPLLKRSGLRIEAWDHHPDSADDIPADIVHLSRCGAVTTSLTLALRERGERLTPEEATLLGLGIYGDTGSFTYSSTTEEDFQAAAWLLGLGMDVNQINEMAAHELTSQHIHALNNLLESARTYFVNNVPVVLAEASLEHYLGDFAHLAHRLMEMEKFTVLFAIGLMGDRIQVVARSRNDAVNVGDICKDLGGGGHVYAASASVRSKMITEVRETILRRLYDQANPEKNAGEYMSSPAVGIEAGATLREADELMLHFGLKAVPVFGPGTRVCVGLLDSQIASRARTHGLGDEPVQEYMKRRVHMLPPEAGIKELTDVIVSERQRLVPIVKGNNVVGVVTRTDLINVFASEAGRLPSPQESVKTRNVSKLIQDRLPRQTRELLHLAGTTGKSLGLPVYAVGGFVRDLLLNVPNQDIDLVVEGNGIALAHALAETLGGRVREHQKFLTSVVIFQDSEGREKRIDVATARLEYYEYPAALPTVELSSIKMDLFRRDFSINSLAVRLDSEPFGQLVDFFGGRRDIKDRLIRVLHTLSFVEDPTRCLRAVRFEQRYQFRIGTGTEKLIRNILPLHLLDKLSPARLFNEFCHIGEEENADACLARLDELGILQALSPQLALTPAKRGLLRRLKEVLAWYRLLYFEEAAQPWLLFFLGLNYHLNYTATSANYARLGLPHARRSEIMRQREAMRAARPRLEAWQAEAAVGTARVSTLCDLLRPLPLEFLLYLMASEDDPGLEKTLSRYITQWRREKADITGEDLCRLGLTPGPDFGRLLASALRAKLDGDAPNAKAQLALVVSLAGGVKREPT